MQFNLHLDTYRRHFIHGKGFWGLVVLVGDTLGLSSTQLKNEICPKSKKCVQVKLLVVDIDAIFLKR